MKIYLAGNFPQMKDVKSELDAANFTLKKCEGSYRRLGSFFYKDPWTENLVKAVQIKKRRRETK
jgi:hypothetical protein